MYAMMEAIVAVPRDGRKAVGRRRKEEGVGTGQKAEGNVPNPDTNQTHCPLFTIQYLPSPIYYSLIPGGSHVFEKEIYDD
jgi:hypothetical protein